MKGSAIGLFGMSAWVDEHSQCSPFADATLPQGVTLGSNSTTPSVLGSVSDLIGWLLMEIQTDRLPAIGLPCSKRLLHL